MLTYEKELWDQGYSFVAGIDEVGRGCLAGSVVAAAVILPVGLRIEGVKDSKQLSGKKREELYDLILSQCIAYGIGIVDAGTIDRINIRQAARLAMKQAVKALGTQADYLLIDAENIELSIPQLKIVKGDSVSHSIAAASIVAKVFRDRKCLEWDRQYPGYGLAQNKGYCTKKHCEALKALGPCPLHRKTFLGNILPEERHEQLGFRFG
jgi:ribonuclease HII